VVLVDGARHVVRYANAAFCLLIDKPSETLIGRPFSEVLPEQAECLELMERVYRSGKSESFTAHEHSDLRSIFGSYTVWPIMDLEHTAGVILQVVNTMSLYEKTLAINEALILGSLRQHELTTAANLSNEARKQAEIALHHANEVLEARVTERTRELTEANARLQAEAQERERVEETLRQSQKMEAIGQLTGGIAHDFNNLLQSISGSLEVAGIRVDQGRTTDLGRYIKTAMASVDRAAALTHRLLAFSRRQTLDPRPTDINRLVGGMVELFDHTVGPGIQIETRLVADPWRTLCDPNQLENVLLNLVINARDAMPDGGLIVIETKNIRLPDVSGSFREQMSRNVPAGEYLTLAVTDTGTGMTPDVASRAFDPFFTTKPLGRGTGLGLSMIYGFVRQSGGQVRLLSQEGQGTTVRTYLPRYRGASDDEEEIDVCSGLPIATREFVILLVDDESAIRSLLVELLSDLGYKTIDTVDGQSGLHILESGTHIDLLLTDVGLPGGMNGRQLADAARRRLPDLKVLFMTGYADGVAVGNGQMERGMQVITKPFKVDALATKILEMVTAN
jgi:signal transduction histidine kinase/CheY-like chemotaxis protein